MEKRIINGVEITLGVSPLICIGINQHGRSVICRAVLHKKEDGSFFVTHAGDRIMVMEQDLDGFYLHTPENRAMLSKAIKEMKE